MIELPSPKSALQTAYHRYRSIRADYDHDRIETTETPPQKAPQHVVVLVIDALRPDASDVIPLDTTSAIAPSTWTFPSVTSVLSGLYPHEHGSTAIISPDESGPLVPKQAEVNTLPGSAEASGWETAAFTGFLTPHLALEGWFQKHRTWNHGTAKSILNKYLDWRRETENSFAYIHLGDLHEPIQPPKRYVEEMEVDTSIPKLATWDEKYLESYGSPESVEYRNQRLKLYTAAGRYVRSQIESILSQIKHDTLIIVTGDHGEAHWEHVELARLFTDSRPAHGAGHGGTPWDMVARVPLSVHDPEGVLTTPNSGGWPSLVDISKTLSERMNLSAEFDGISWSQSLPNDRGVLCEGAHYGSERKAVYLNNEKLIYGEDGEVVLVGSVSCSQPGEDIRRVSEIPEQFKKWLPKDNNKTKSGDLGTMAENQLEALGYK